MLPCSFESLCSLELPLTLTKRSLLLRNASHSLGTPPTPSSRPPDKSFARQAPRNLLPSLFVLIVPVSTSNLPRSICFRLLNWCSNLAPLLNCICFHPLRSLSLEIPLKGLRFQGVSVSSVYCFCCVFPLHCVSIVPCHCHAFHFAINRLCITFHLACVLPIGSDEVRPLASDPTFHHAKEADVFVFTVRPDA